jgi:hypothetical protein
MTYDEFNDAVAYNKRMLEHVLKNGKSLTEVLHLLKFWNANPSPHWTQLCLNSFDLISAAYLGLLADINRQGTDAYRVLPTGSVEKYELKTGSIKGDCIWKGPRGGLYVGEPVKNKYAAITSKLSASYAIHTTENINSKRMRTVLLITDEADPDGFIDAWEMDGDIVVDNYIKNRKGNLTIKLGSFMKHGKRAETVIPLEGFDAWSDRIRKLAPMQRILRK